MLNNKDFLYGESFCQSEREKDIDISIKIAAGPAAETQVHINASPGGMFCALCELIGIWAKMHPERMREAAISLLRDQCLSELSEEL